MKRFAWLFVGFIQVIGFLTAPPASAQWIKVTNGLPPVGSGLGWGAGWAIDAVSQSTAVVALSRGGVFRTTDGGANWKSLGFSYSDCIDVSIVDSSHIWVAGGYAGAIYATSNGGQTWNVQFQDTTKTDFINYIKMFDLNNGIAMGDALTDSTLTAFLRTSDGGTHWTMVNRSATGWSFDGWRMIDFPTPTVGYFFASGGPWRFYKTTDGGSAWSLLSMGWSKGLYVLKFYNERLGLVRALDGGLYRTLDGGSTWDSLPRPSPHWGEAFSFAPGNPAKVWFLDSDDLYFSSDTGRTWTAQLHVTGGPSSGRDIVFTDAQHGWLLGDKDILYRTDNGGDPLPTGIGEESRVVPKEFSLFPNYPNPFNPTTTIKYTLPEAAQVTLTLYSVLGQQIMVLVNERQEPGYHEVTLRGLSLGSGVYLLRLQAGGFMASRKLLLAK